MPQINGYYCKKWELKDSSKLKNFLKKSNFPKYRIDRIFWTLFKSPFKKGTFVTILKSSKLAAFGYVIPRHIIFKKKKFLVIETGESFTYAQHRKKGLFDKVLKNSLLYKKSICGFMTTPNLASARAYEKLGYKIYNKLENKFLVYYPIKKKNNFLKKISVILLNKNQYFQKTKNFKRLNNMNKSYFDWRFGNPATKYFFYEIKFEKKIFLCCFRFGLPSPVNSSQVNILVESFEKMNRTNLGDTKLVLDTINQFNKSKTPTLFVSNIKNYNEKKLKSEGIYFKDIWLYYKKLKKISINLSSYQLSDSDYG